MRSWRKRLSFRIEIVRSINSRVLLTLWTHALQQGRVGWRARIWVAARWGVQAEVALHTHCFGGAHDCGGVTINWATGLDNYHWSTVLIALAVAGIALAVRHAIA